MNTRLLLRMTHTSHVTPDTLHNTYLLLMERLRILRKLCSWTHPNLLIKHTSRITPYTLHVTPDTLHNTYLLLMVRLRIVRKVCSLANTLSSLISLISSCACRIHTHTYTHTHTHTCTHTHAHTHTHTHRESRSKTGQTLSSSADLFGSLIFWIDSSYIFLIDLYYKHIHARTWWTHAQNTAEDLAAECIVAHSIDLYIYGTTSLHVICAGEWVVCCVGKISFKKSADGVLVGWNIRKSHFLGLTLVGLHKFSSRISHFQHSFHMFSSGFFSSCIFRNHISGIDSQV